MPTTPALPGLDAFLAALRLHDIPVGPQEVLWLRHAFRLEPELDRQGLQNLLACTLIKHEAHHEQFTVLFDAWCQDEAHPVPPGPEARVVPSVFNESISDPMPHPDRPESPPPPLGPCPVWRRWGLLASLLVVVGAGLVYLWLSRQTVVVPPGPEERVAAAPRPPDTLDLPADPTPHFWTWVPHVTVSSPPFWLAVGLGLLTTAGGLTLWWRYRRAYALPPPEPPAEAGPQWLPLPAPGPGAPTWLDPDALRSAVWGVEYFVAEEATSQIAVAPTVAATARAGGVPTLRFAQARYPRAVWLLQDSMLQDPTVDGVLQEVAQRLARAGLAVQVGTFYGTPTLIRWREGQEWSPLAMEGYRQHAMVLIVTNGDGMQRAAASELEKHTLDAVLRALGEWPRLAFVDPGTGSAVLTAQVQSYGLRCLHPADIPAWLGARPTSSIAPHRGAATLHSELRLWAAATALAAEPVRAETALDLRAHLGLALSSWSLRDLYSVAGSAGEGLDWEPRPAHGLAQLVGGVFYGCPSYSGAGQFSESSPGLLAAALCSSQGRARGAAQSPAALATHPGGVAPASGESAPNTLA
jgi:hypothetical protein